VRWLSLEFNSKKGRFLHLPNLGGTSQEKRQEALKIQKNPGQWWPGWSARALMTYQFG